MNDAATNGRKESSMRQVTYKGKKYTLEEGTAIQVNWRPVFSTETGPNWKNATIQSLLNVQFTAIVEVDGNPLAYHFYDAVDGTWRPV
jgi:hypothetical protein